MLVNDDCLHYLQTVENNTFDLLVTDPPYGISFMGKDWDKALPNQEIWRQCFRVLKEGKMAFVMCSPRQDVLSRMIISLEDAGFRTNYTSIYWTYASGFPKAANISKLIDKKGTENHRYSELSKELCDYLKSSREKLGLSQKDIAKYFLSKTGGLTGCVWNWENGANIPTMEEWEKLKTILKLTDIKFIELIERAISKRIEAEREIIGSDRKADLKEHVYFGDLEKAKQKGKSIGYGSWDITKPATEQAKKMEGAYVGFQPKPAVEVILVVSKPKTKKTEKSILLEIEQEMKKQHGISNIEWE